MKTLVKLFALICAITILTGCIDMYQHITATDSNTVHVYTQMTFAKSLFKLIGSMSGASDEPDYDELMGEFSSDAYSEYPELALELESIDSELEMGYTINYDFQKNNANYNSYILENEISFLPRIENDEILIDIRFEMPDMDVDQESGEYETLSNAFLGAAKYRISIDKSLMPKINEARMFFDGRSIALKTHDYGNGFLLDIPFLLIIGKTVTIVIK